MGSRDGCCVVCVGSIFRRYLVDQMLVSLGVSRKELEPSDVQYMPCCGRSIHHSCVRAWFGFLLSKNCLVLCPYCHDRITGPVFRHGLCKVRRRFIDFSSKTIPLRLNAGRRDPSPDDRASTSWARQPGFLRRVLASQA